LKPDEIGVKKWVSKLIHQFDFEWSQKAQAGEGEIPHHMSEELASLLYLIDIFNKHLIEFDGYPVRKVREQLDAFAKELLQPDEDGLERVLFRFRQFISGYRIAETAYLQKTFDEFRTIIWDLVDQLAEDLGQEQREDFEIRKSLDELKDAVESNSIDVLRNQSRKFIDRYMEKQFKKEERHTSRMKTIRKNLEQTKKQLLEANDKMRTDHLTQALNRKSFDEYVQQYHKLVEISKAPVSLCLVDIDHFKRINDTFGHAVGDFVLVELVKTLKALFMRESDVLARIGGEEFAIILPDYQMEHAMKKAEEILNRVRAEVFVHEGREIRFTVSLGIAQLSFGETVESWIKRADQALYHSKNTGRNRATSAPPPLIRAA
jgi:diguanylate cyclase (GGDEF)-like protein